MHPTYLILGFGITGKAAAYYCKQNNYNYYVYVDNRAALENPALDNPALDNKEHFDQPFISLDEIKCIATKITAVIQSAGIPLTHQLSKWAIQNNIPITSDVTLLLDHKNCPPCLGITGTNGKSTVTVITKHILNECGINAVAGGNIGVGSLDLISKHASAAIYVLELSSYMLEISPALLLHGAALINLTSDHLDRHINMENYCQQKLKIFKNTSFGVMGLDSKVMVDLWNKMDPSDYKTLKYLIGIEVTSTHINFISHPLFAYDNGDFLENINRSTITNANLSGDHNHLNIGIACALALPTLLDKGVSYGQILEAINNFSGLEHRQQIVTRKHGILFVNDSKATNAQATLMALKAYQNHKIFLILGGQPKEDGISDIISHLQSVETIFMIGAAALSFETCLMLAKANNNKLYIPKIVICEKLDVAVNKAFQEALHYHTANPHISAVVMLSPACASFDQFKNFEHRGTEFIRDVEAL